MIHKSFAKLGLQPAEILLPRPGLDLTRYAVVACDQYTSQPEYWDEADRFVGSAPSTLRMILPECHLEKPDVEARIAAVQDAMKRSCADGTLRSVGTGFVLVERTLASGKKRIGLAAALDLERYSYEKDAKPLIRPTEGTIVERLPPRIRIRGAALLELPHILILIDDARRTVIEPLYEQRSGLTALYDFPLMKDAGRLAGWHVSKEEDLAAVASALSVLADPASFRARYGNDDVLLFAVGDGNHSLATAKAVWENLKKSGHKITEDHPARHALVEIVNLYDESLEFEPIHRLLVGTKAEAFLEFIASKPGIRFEKTQTAPLPKELDRRGSAFSVGVSWDHGAGRLLIEDPTASVCAGAVEKLLAEFRNGRSGVSIDYIHGDETLIGLSRKPSHLGFLVPVLPKSELFPAVIQGKVLPKKSFSMGHADEKRFYLEARKISG